MNTSINKKELVGVIQKLKAPFKRLRPYWYCPVCRDIVYGKTEPFLSMCGYVGDVSLLSRKEVKDIQAKWKPLFIKG